jgi:hypothetical protein
MVPGNQQHAAQKDVTFMRIGSKLTREALLGADGNLLLADKRIA